MPSSTWRWSTSWWRPTSRSRTHPVAVVDEESARIGALVADGCPTAPPSRPVSARCPTRPCTASSGRRGLRIWTEMFSDSVLALERAGALDRSRADHRVVPVRLRGAARLGRRQRTRPHDPHRGHQRPRPDRPEPGDGQRQHRAPGRPLRAGERLPDPGSDPLRVRWPDRLHRGRAAQPGRPGDHRTAFVAPQGGLSTIVPSSTSRSPRSR